MTIMQQADHDDLIDNTLDPQAHEEKRELNTKPVEELVTAQFLMLGTPNIFPVLPVMSSWFRAHSVELVV